MISETTDHLGKCLGKFDETLNSRKIRLNPPIGEIRFIFGATRAPSTGLGRFCRMDEPIPNTMRRTKNGMSNAPAFQNRCDDRATTSVDVLSCQASGCSKNILQRFRDGGEALRQEENDKDIDGDNRGEHGDLAREGRVALLHGVGHFFSVGDSVLLSLS